MAVIEVGLGGRYDCTNVIDHPALTAITHLGYDHCSILGECVELVTTLVACCFVVVDIWGVCRVVPLIKACVNALRA